MSVEPLWEQPAYGTRVVLVSLTTTFRGRLSYERWPLSNAQGVWKTCQIIRCAWHAHALNGQGSSLGHCRPSRYRRTWLCNDVTCVPVTSRSRLLGKSELGSVHEHPEARAIDFELHVNDCIIGMPSGPPYRKQWDSNKQRRLCPV